MRLYLELLLKFLDRFLVTAKNSEKESNHKVDIRAVRVDFSRLSVFSQCVERELAGR